MSGRSKVTIFHQILGKGGGMEHYALDLVRSFNALDLEVHFFCRCADRGLARELGVHVELSRSHSLFRQLRDWSFHRAAQKASQRTPWRQVGLSRVPVRDISICGGTHLGYLQNTRGRRTPLDSLFIRLEQRSYSAARKVVAHSLLCQKELARLYRVPEEKITTLFPPCASNYQPQDQAKARAALGLPENKVVFLFPSMGHRRKGFHHIAKVFPEFADRAVLAIAGNPPGLTAPWLRPLGYIDSMEQAYSAADFTILASLYEPFGLVGPESVLCGTRVVFDSRIGCLDALDPQAVISFDLWKPGTMEAAIRAALDLHSHKKHKLTTGDAMLKYDPDPILHARRLMDLL